MEGISTYLPVVTDVNGIKYPIKRFRLVYLIPILQTKNNKMIRLLLPRCAPNWSRKTQTKSKNIEKISPGNRN